MVWYDRDRKAVEQTILPEISFIVAANPAFQGDDGLVAGDDDPVWTVKRWAEAALSWLRSNIVSLNLAAMALYIAALAFRRFALPLYARWRAYRERFLHSEQYAFRTFRRACRSRDTGRMINSFWQWLDRLTPDDRIASLEGMARRVDDPDFEEFVQEFARARYSRSSTDMPKTDIANKPVARFRKSLLRRNQPVAANNDMLNPRDSRNTTGQLNAAQLR